MTYKDFIKAMICNLSQPVFDELKKMLLGEYIFFSIIDHEDVTVDILAEKICDYFVTLEIKTSKSFNEHVKCYMTNLNSIVEPHIAKTPKTKKRDTTPVINPRSRKYYEKVSAYKNVENPSINQLIDFSRIMMCLYSAAINTKAKFIDNFDFSISCLAPEKIVESMKNEEYSTHSLKRKKSDTKEPYSDKMCTLILSILVLYAIVNRKVEGETDHD